MKILRLVVGAMGTNAYIVYDEITKDAALVDPGDEEEMLLNAVLSKGLDVTKIILTHAHFDHILALNKIKEQTGASLFVHEYDAPYLLDNSLNLLSRFSSRGQDFPSADILLKDGDKIELGNEEITVCHTPGHTPGSICLICGDDLISGDTLFRGSIGRCDFPGGDFDTIMVSLQKIVSLGVNGKIFPGHGPSTTLEQELNYNTYLI